MRKRTIIAVNGFLLMGSILSSHANYHPIQEAFEGYSRERIKRARHFESDKKNPFALDMEKASLSQIRTIKRKVLNTRNNEFSTIRCTDSLLKATIANDLKVTHVEGLEGGFVSGKIYRIEAQSEVNDLGTSQHFFLKYLRQRPILVDLDRCLREEKNLVDLMKNPRIKEMQQYINIVLPEVIATYKGKNEKNKTFMLLPGAPGESLSDIVQTNDVDKINEAFSALGSSLAKMHIRHRFFEGGDPTTMNDFMKTRVPSHTDFHGKNVFYCPKTKKISFIDVETMANSFDSDNKPNSPISYDLLYMLLMSAKTFGSFMPKNDWDPFKKFLNAYTSEYKPHERTGILNYLESSFRQAKKIAFTDIFKHFLWKKTMSSQDAEGMKELTQHIRDLKSQQLSDFGYQPLNFMSKKKILSQEVKVNRHIQYIESQQLSALRHQPLKNKGSSYSKYTKNRIKEYYANIRYYEGRVEKF